MKEKQVGDVMICNMYDLPIEAFLINDFWETSDNEFILSFGRVMKKEDLSMDCFDDLLKHYSTQTDCKDIDKLIMDYLKDHEDDFIRDEQNSLRPLKKGDNYYSSHWGDYV